MVVSKLALLCVNMAENQNLSDGFLVNVSN